MAMGPAEVWASVGPGLAGAVFGGGWWFWVDAAVCSSMTVPFLHYLPGHTILPPSIATLQLGLLVPIETQTIALVGSFRSLIIAIGDTGEVFKCF